MRAMLPALESRCDMNVLGSLKLLVLSGEVLPLSLWDTLSKMLPGTCILNLYGSTEVRVYRYSFNLTSDSLREILCLV